MITTNENYHLDEIIPKLKAYNTGKVVEKVTCSEKSVLKGEGFKLHFWILAQRTTSHVP